MSIKAYNTITAEPCHNLSINKQQYRQSNSMSSHRYSIVEPHPSVPATQAFISTGRGGSGNAVKTPSTVTRGSDASGPAARASIASITAPRQNYMVGRGGAGNATSDAPRMFSFDEELAFQMKKASKPAPVYHVGRGGAGNLHSSKTMTPRRDSDLSDSSISSAESGADIATRNLKKGFKKFGGFF